MDITMIECGASTEECGHEYEKLLGTWKLVAASSTTATGKRNEAPYGQCPIGFLTYSSDRRVTVLISHGLRKPLSIERGGGESVEEQAEAFRTFLAYAGRYTFSGYKVTHHIEISSIENYVNKDLVRGVAFRGEQLVLLTPPTIMIGKIEVVELIWQRIPIGSKGKKHESPVLSFE
jgi:hypothetical protein